MKKSGIKIALTKTKGRLKESFANFFNSKFRLLLICLTIVCGSSIAQTYVSDAYIKTESTGGNNVSCTYVIEVSDTSNLDEVELILGTVKDGNDLVSCVFNFQQQTGLPNGMSYSRAGNKLTFSGIILHELSLYCGRIKLKENGSWASAFYFISN